MAPRKRVRIQTPNKPLSRDLTALEEAETVVIAPPEPRTTVVLKLAGVKYPVEAVNVVPAGALKEAPLPVAAGTESEEDGVAGAAVGVDVVAGGGDVDAGVVVAGVVLGDLEVTILVDGELLTLVVVVMVVLATDVVALGGECADDPTELTPPEEAALVVAHIPMLAMEAKNAKNIK